MKKWVLLSVLVLIIASGGVAFYILSQPPKEKLSDEFKEEAVSRLLGRKANLNPEEVPTGNTFYKGKYITFQYPAKALEYTYRDSSNSANLEDFSFDISSPKLVFNMTVIDGGGVYDDVPAVRLREQRSYEYEKKAVKADGVEGISFYKSAPQPEKSGFFLKGGKLFTISITGTSDKEVGKLFDDIISTVSFVN